jgi:hypothetical protein
LMAAIATFALKAGVWFRRGRRFMVAKVEYLYSDEMKSLKSKNVGVFHSPSMLGLIWCSLK